MKQEKKVDNEGLLLQLEKKRNSIYTATIIDFKSRKLRQQQVDDSNNENIKKSCFRTNHSYYCSDTECNSWNECHKLIAEWMR